MRGAFAFMCLGLFGCSPNGDAAGTDGQDGSAGAALEQAAVATGILSASGAVSLSGAYERVSDIGVDRFCAVGNDDDGYQVGMLAEFGPDTVCEAIGSAERDGEDVTIILSGKDQCQFVAQFDGDTIVFPGGLPAGCQSYCGPRARLDGVNFHLLGSGDEIARSTRGHQTADRKAISLCPG